MWSLASHGRSRLSEVKKCFFLKNQRLRALRFSVLRGLYQLMVSKEDLRMYSVVLLMAISNGAEAPAFHRHSCNGASACAGTVVVASACHGGVTCNGCHGGRHARHGRRHGCHGCNGGYACAGYVGCAGGVGCTGGAVVPAPAPAGGPAPKEMPK